ncbi:MAG: PfkB family carbohydrate kinase [Acidimicrobiia bacterium]|jgi:sugar/nucleoside kinase (ribokinase family)
MLCTIGDLVQDIVVWPAADPVHGTDTPARIFHRRGGSAATVAVQAAAVGTPARFVGQVGDDPLGEMLTGQLELAGVQVLVRRKGRTGSVLVLVDPTGERTMLPDRAAATELSELPAGALDGVTWLHVPSYSLVVEPLGATCLGAITLARDAGITVSVDASSTGPLRSYGVDRFLKLIAALQPDVFFCNEDEADALGVAAEAAMPGASTTVIKAGSNPVTLVDSAGETTMVAVPPVATVNDTTGAGDAFAAGYIVSAMAGSDPVSATNTGIRLAASVLTSPGAGTER